MQRFTFGCRMGELLAKRTRSWATGNGLFPSLRFLASQQAGKRRRPIGVTGKALLRLTAIQTPLHYGLIAPRKPAELFPRNFVTLCIPISAPCGLESSSEIYGPRMAARLRTTRGRAPVDGLFPGAADDRRPGLAEEIAQDVFLELDRHLGKIESPLHALYWLRRVAMSRSADALQAAQGARHGFVGGDGRQSRRVGRKKSSPLGSRLEALLTTLPEPQRAALVLRYQEDLTPEEIAATLDAPLATVKSNLQRGLKLLRAKAECHLKDFICPSEGAVEWTLNPMDGLRHATTSSQLQRALERRPAPPSLKRKLMERRSRQQTERVRFNGW